MNMAKERDALGVKLQDAKRLSNTLGRVLQMLNAHDDDDDDYDDFVNFGINFLQKHFLNHNLFYMKMKIEFLNKKSKQFHLVSRI